MPITLGMLAPRRQTQLAYQTSAVDTTNRTTYTFSGVAFGAVDSSRLLVVMVTRSASAVTSVTIGGVSASLVQFGGTAGDNNSIYAAVVPTGTSGNVVVSGASTAFGAGIAVWALYGVNPTKKSSGVKSTTSNYPALTLAEGDIAIFCDWNGSSVTYTNATKNAGYFVSGVEATGASYRAASPETRTVSNTSGAVTYSAYAVWGR